MSTLARYRKPGGFKQLLILIETSTTAKREQLLKIVGQEDKRWAEELTKRMITAQKIFLFPSEAIEKIMQTIPEQTWPKGLFHMNEEERQKLLVALLQFLPVHKQKAVQDYIATLKPTPGEIEAAHSLMVKKARELQAAGELKLEKFDASLVMEGIDRMVI